MTELLTGLMQDYGYGILFLWSILEGELGLVMAGLLVASGDMNLFMAIFIAGVGGFVGDQIYFYIGRYNKEYVTRKFKSQRRNFAHAHLLLKKHGWPIIFFQRYMYGLRVIIPMSIGITRYSAKVYAFINLISAWAWAAITIVPVWYFGNEILEIINIAKDYWYYSIPIIVIVGIIVFYFIRKKSKKDN